MQVYLRNPLTGEQKKRKRGFSWTTLLLALAGGLPRRLEVGRDRLRGLCPARDPHSRAGRRRLRDLGRLLVQRVASQRSSRQGLC